MNNLDLTRLSDRVFVSGMIWKRRTEKQSHRNNCEELAEYLNSKHPNEYLIYNLTFNSSTQISNDQQQQDFIHCKPFYSY
jgi:isocitrate lyase